MNQDLKQPKALYLLFFVQMWECFSYYGMRILLVLYMSQVLGFSDSSAFGVFAIYCALVEFGGIFGGRLADRLLGQRACISLGGWLIASGHICMMFGKSAAILYLSLALIATGTGLFSSNISSLLGLYYGEDDPRREEGYTLFYIGLNLGAVLASLCCGTAATLFGWHSGFGLAALGMIVGNCALMFLGQTLGSKGFAPEQVPLKTKLMILLGICGTVLAAAIALSYEYLMMRLIPVACLATVLYAGFMIYNRGNIGRKKLIMLSAYLAILTVFYAAEEQIGSSLMLFSERYSDGTLFGLAVPSAVLVGANPFIIICFGILVSKAANFLKITGALRLSIGCILSALAFLWLSTCASQGDAPLLAILSGIMIISIGELLVGPTIYAFFSEAAPQKLQGLTMGLIPVGYSMASVLSGFFSQSMADDRAELSSGLYAAGFLKISLILFAAGGAIYLLNYVLREKESGSIWNQLSTERQKI